MVNFLTEGSEVHSAGIRRGDVVTRLNGRAVQGIPGYQTIAQLEETSQIQEGVQQGLDDLLNMMDVHDEHEDQHQGLLGRWRPGGRQNQRRRQYLVTIEFQKRPTRFECGNGMCHWLRFQRGKRSWCGSCREHILVSGQPKAYHDEKTCEGAFMEHYMVLHEGNAQFAAQIARQAALEAGEVCEVKKCPNPACGEAVMKIGGCDVMRCGGDPHTRDTANRQRVPCAACGSTGTNQQGVKCSECDGRGYNGGAQGCGEMFFWSEAKPLEVGEHIEAPLAPTGRLLVQNQLDLDHRAIPHNAKKALTSCTPLLGLVGATAAGIAFIHGGWVIVAGKVILIDGVYVCGASCVMRRMQARNQRLAREQLAATRWESLIGAALPAAHAQDRAGAREFLIPRDRQLEML